MDLRRDARQIFAKALEAADAGNAVRRFLRRRRSTVFIGQQTLDLDRFDRISLLAVGKAAVPMARAVHDVLGDRVTESLIVTKHGHGESIGEFACMEAGHPVPDEAGLHAAETVRQFVSTHGERDLLLVSVSGGASALLPAPAPPLKLADKQSTTSLLLKAGANIEELNAVRKHLSFLKGGQLAALAYPATVLGLVLSDVIGDRIDVIASGLSAPDPTTYADALAVLDRYQLRDRVPDPVRKHLEQGFAETPKPGDPVFERVHNVVVGSNRLALEAAAEEARALGYRTRIVSTELAGEAREVAAACVEELHHEIERPVCLLAGGETTVHVRGAGKGGRNQEFALAAAIAIDGTQNVAVLSAGTDGTDGPTDAAGAIATGDTVARAAALGMNAQQYLAANDSYTFFDNLGDLIKIGPTGTNVMDVCVLLAG